MARGSLNLKVSKGDFERRMQIIQMRMDALADVVQRYKHAKTNLDQFIENGDDNFQAMCERIDVNIDAAGRAYAALKEIRVEMEKTVSQMSEFSGKVNETVSSATEAAKSSIQAAIRVNSLL